MITKIYKNQIDLSYNKDHKIYDYIKSKVNNSNEYYFDNQLVITMNQFYRIDMTMQIINKNIQMIMQINNNKIKNLFLSCNPLIIIENDKQYLNDLFNDNINNNILSLIDNYDNNNIHNAILWINSLYDKINNLFDDRDKEQNNADEIISLIYVVGLFEWYHISLIYDHVNQNNNKKCSMYLGEYIMFDLGLESKYSNKLIEIKQFCKSKYYSHAIIFIVDKNNLLIYDPDDDPINETTTMYKKTMSVIDNFCNIINKTNETGKIRLKYPIQSLSSADKYCIYHCIMLILKIGSTKKKYNYNCLIKKILKLDKIHPNMKMNTILNNINNLIDLSMK